MNRTSFFSILFLSFFNCFFLLPALHAQSPGNGRYNIIPYPSSLVPKEGEFFFNKQTTLTLVTGGGNIFNNEAVFLQQMIGRSMGSDVLKRDDKAVANTIVLQYDPSVPAEEGYTLVIESRRAVLKARTPAGMFHALQTFRQLLPAGVETGAAHSLSVPAVVINDHPAYAWRGLMLDVSRHFFSPAYVKKFIDMMALYKYNTLHLHLTDDQGWRIEIKKYPRLTDESGWRTYNNQDSIDIETGMETGNPDFFMDSTRLRYRNGRTEYGGFFTQEQMKDLIRYAASRHIEIIPEIDMPGHMMAAVMLYPWLICDDSTGENASRRFSNPICPCKDSSIQFARNVLSEIMALFPSRYIHIGGDEVDKRGWENSALCRAFMTKNNIKTLEQLQSYFNDQLLAFFHSHGKTLVGWDEIVEGGIDTSAVVMFWRPDSKKTIVQATLNGNKVVLTPDGPFYFDAVPDKHTLSNVYHYNPGDTAYGYGLNEAQLQNIIGVQGNLWTEWIITESRADYMIMPRMTALAELGWTHKDLYDSYLKRLDGQYDRLDKLGIHYYLPNLPDLEDRRVFIDTASFFTEPPSPSLTLRYTIDGKVPDPLSPVLSHSILIDHSLTLKLASFSAGGNRSAMNILSFDRQSYAKPVVPGNQQPGLACSLYRGYFPKTTEIKSVADSVMQVQQAMVPKGIPPTPFGLKFKGFIEVPETGIYKFFLTADDGGVLYIADRLVVDNDGEHGPREKSGQVALAKGQHSFALNYMNASYGYTLYLKYSKDGGDPQIVPASWFKSGE